MILTKLAIRRGVTFAMIYLIAIGFGLFGLSSLRLDLYPDITFPIIAVVSQYPGVGPEDLENVLTRPLEEAVIAVENVSKITSRTGSGTASIIMEFDWGADMDQAEIDVRKMIDFARDYLPPEATDPLVLAFDPSMQPIIYSAVSSDQLGIAELRRVVQEQVEPRLERIPGVAAADVEGGLERQINVLVNPIELAANGISIQQLVQILRMENLQIPGGVIDETYKEFSVKTYGEYTNLAQIENTVVGNKNGIPIYLKNVAKVVDGFKEQRQVARNNRRPAMMLYIMKQADANTVQTSRKVARELPGIIAKVGQGVRIETIIDFADFINSSISNLSRTALQAFLLAFLVLLFFLRRVRSALIVAVAIPVSVVVTFFVMRQAGITLNVISMAGLALAIGMLVDNAIVVLENIFRHKEAGSPLRKAADEGTTQVSMAIIASTLTTLAVFIPILFVPGIAGIMFNDMALTIVFSLSTSLLVALTLIPLLASRWMRTKSTTIKQRHLRFISDKIGVFLQRLETVYIRSLDFFLRRKIILLIGIAILFAITVVIAPSVGGDFLGKTDQSFIGINVERASGTALTATNQTFVTLENIIDKEVPEAFNTYLSFGTGDVFSALFAGAGSHKGRIMLSLPDVKERDRDQFVIQDSLRSIFAKIPGAKVTFDEGGGPPGMGGEGDISIKIFGFDRLLAASIGDQVAAAIKKIEGVVDVQKSYSAPSPEYQIFLNRDRIAALGLSVSQVAMTIETSIKGTIATQYREGGQEIDVLVRFDEPFRGSKIDLEQIYLSAPTGAQIPLINVADIVPGESATLITREDQERRVTVSCTVTGRDLQSVTGDVKASLNRLNFPPEFRWEIGGTAEEQMQSFVYLFMALIAAVLLVYMVMASQFESLLNPFIILFSIPLGFIGVIWGLFITGTTLSVTALIGGMLLVGIVVNNGIVLIDYINQLREKQGYELWKAVIVGGRRRMRPILMTALTTTLSMMPLAIEIGSGAEIWSPMARAVIGGLTASSFFTLLLIPVLYFMLERKLLRRAIKKGKAEPQQIERPAGVDFLSLE